MKCPVDGNDLVMSERQNVEIDYCPSCRGVWLDRGELDKIIDRVVATEAQHAQPAPAPPPQQPAPQPAPASAQQPSYQQPYHDKRKKKSHWLGELFD
ncbi:MAG: zf-TFIIB domain-containing protein [Candidatus Nanopelagicales bacterium]